ncbi:MAG: hypothetical protein GF330_04200 [Candidatus Eisenbacteria bacterium]|nr:hypothetical protein [Candidatus Eisenbacteria bacterium]
MIALLLRAILAVLVFSLVMSGVRALGTWLQRRNARRRAGPASGPQRMRRRGSSQGVKLPPEEVIDVPYRTVPSDESEEEEP